MKLILAPLTLLITCYQKFISPIFAPRCKYYPSCSNYALTAIKTYGLKGVVMTIWRVLRCNPWSHGGVDYVKPKVKNNEKTITEQSLETMKAAA
ncbi:MAG: membrane protein insertion efficiency factor YidD [Candidatus Planktophila sp.]